MALFCPNINSPEYKKLKSAVGSDSLAYYYWNKFEGKLPEDFYEETTNEIIEQPTQEITPDVEQRFGIAGSARTLAEDQLETLKLVEKAKQYIYRTTEKDYNKKEDEGLTNKKIELIKKL